MSRGPRLLIVFGPQFCWRAKATVMPASQITLDKWVDGLLAALTMMNDTMSAHTTMLARICEMLSEIDSTLQYLCEQIS